MLKNQTINLIKAKLNQVNKYCNQDNKNYAALTVTKNDYNKQLKKLENN